MPSLSCSHLWWTWMCYREFSTHYLRLNAFKCKFIPSVYFSKITALVPQSAAIGWLNEESFSSLLTACQHIPEAWQEMTDSHGRDRELTDGLLRGAEVQGKFGRENRSMLSDSKPSKTWRVTTCECRERLPPSHTHTHTRLWKTAWIIYVCN